MIEKFSALKQTIALRLNTYLYHKRRFKQILWAQTPFVESINMILNSFFHLLVNLFY